MLLPSQITEINAYYTMEPAGLSLIGFLDVTEMVAAANTLEKYEWNQSDEQRAALRNSFSYIACDAASGSKQLKVIPVFKGCGQVNLYVIGQSKFNQDQSPWVLYFKGSDDISYALRFKTEDELQNYLALGPEVGELEMDTIN